MATKNTKLAKLLLERGMTSKDLVIGAKINKTHVSMIKNGQQNITMVTLRKMCLFLKCSPNDVIDWEKWLDNNKPAA